MVRDCIQQKKENSIRKENKNAWEIHKKKHMNVYDLMSSKDESEMKLHFQLLQFDFHYVENNTYKQ